MRQRPEGPQEASPELPLPNTLAHFAIQGAASRGFARDLEPRWIYLACVLPDVAWIGRRLVAGLGPPLDPVELRLYAMVQASLAGSLVLAAALALLSRRPRPVVALLGAGALMHLLLDACEEKWGNGVHLLAPFDWTLTRFDLVPGGGWLDLILSAAGALLVAYELRRRPPPLAKLPPPPPRRRAAAAALLLVYLLGPLPLMPAVLESDSYSVLTLSEPERERRTGRRVGLDRVRLERDEDGPRIALWTGERVRATGALPESEVRLSLEGRFLAPDRLRVERYAVPRFDRDWPSYVGLGLLALLWLRPLVRRRSGDHGPP